MEGDHGMDGSNATVPQPAADPRRLQLLSAAFKGSVSHGVVQNTMRKPSVLTLTRRVDPASEPSVNRSAKDDMHEQRRNQSPDGTQSSGHPVQNAVPFGSNGGPEQHTTETARADPEEERRKELLSTIQFHRHSDQSIPRADLQVLAESKWLREFPQSRAWDALHGRIAHYQSEEGMLAKAAEKEMAERFIDTAELQGAEHVNNLLNGADNEKERLVVRMTFALLDDAVGELIAEIGREALGNAKIAWNVLNKSLIKSVASVSLGLEGNGSRYWKMSGREHVLRGILADAQRDARTKAANNSETNSQEYKTEEDMVEAALPILDAPAVATAEDLSPAYEKLVPLPHPLPDADADEVEDEGDAADVAAMTALSSASRGAVAGKSLMHVPSMHSVSGEGQETHQLHQQSTRPALEPAQQLYELEVEHWSGISLNMAVNAPLQVPSTIATAVSSSSNRSGTGVVSAVRLCAQPALNYASTLLCGLCNGRIASYAVKWTGQPAELVGASAALDKKDQSPVVDIKLPSFGSSMVVSRTQSGTIYVHHMNWALSADTDSGLAPVARKGSSWFPFSLFTKKAAKSTVQLIPLLFRIDPADGIFSMPSMLDALKVADHSSTHDASTAALDVPAPVVGGAGSKTGGGVDSSLLPTDMCFHPSIGLTGTSTSIMVGNAAGDVVKYNMDYLVSNLAGTVVYPTPPFVTKEFIHPLNAPTGFVLTSAVSDKRGNRVFRELFHYHKSKIVLLEPVGRLSRYMVSVDQTGLVAVWLYNPSCFEGKCWFRPHRTARLSLHASDLVPVGLSARPDKDEGEGAAVDGASATPAASLQTQSSTENRISRRKKMQISTTTTEGASAQEGAPAPRKHTTRPPDASLLAQLKVREVFVDTERQRTYKWYCPVYSETRQAWLQLRSVEYEEPIVADPDPDLTGVIVTSTGAALPASPNRLKVTKKVFSAAKSLSAANSAASLASTGSATKDAPAEQAGGAGADASAVVSGLGAGAQGEPANSVPPAASTTSATAGSEEVTLRPVVAQVTDSNEGTTTRVGSDSADKQKENVANAEVRDGTAAAGDGGLGESPLSASVPPRDAAPGASEGNDENKKVEGAMATSVLEADSSLPTIGATDSAEPAATTSMPDTTERTEKEAALTMSVDIADGQGGDAEVEVALLEGAEEGELKLVPSAAAVPGDVDSAGPAVRSTPPAVSVPGPARDVSGEFLPHAGLRLRLDGTDTPPEETPPSPGQQGPVLMSASPGSSPPHSPVASAPALLDLPADFPSTVFTHLKQHFHQPLASSESAKLEPSAKELTREESTHVMKVRAPLPTPALTPASSAHGQGLSAAHVDAAVPMRRVVEWNDGDLLEERDLSFTILSAKMTGDGTEMVMLLASRLGSAAPGKPSAKADESGVTANLTVYYIVPYHGMTEKFHKAYPRLYLHSDTDRVVDFCVGPICLETHTRSAFVLTRHAVRVFSMHTGREIITKSVPFVWDLASFSPNLITVCPSHRVLTLAATDDARIAVYQLQHTDDGTTHKTHEQEIRDQELRRSLFASVRGAGAYTERWHAEGTEDAHIEAPHHEHAVRTVLNIVLPPVELYEEVIVDIQDIVDSLLAHVMRGIDLIHDRQRKAGFIAELFEGNLGYIAPTIWPPPITALPPLQLSHPDSKHVEDVLSDSDDAFSPNNIGKNRLRAKLAKRKRRRAKKVLLEGDAALESL